MLDFPRWRVWMLSSLIAASLLLALPSFLPKAWLDQLPSWVPAEQINLGLDLAGGSHILLEADRVQFRAVAEN
jgi:preprotein translocase subunit SecD